MSSSSRDTSLSGSAAGSTSASGSVASNDSSNKSSTDVSGDKSSTDVSGSVSGSTNNSGSVASTGSTGSSTDKTSSSSTDIGSTSNTSGSTTGTTATQGGTSRSSTDVAAATTGGSSDVSTRITEWHLGAADIQADIDRGGTIVRTKDSIVGAPTGNTDDSVIETMVKGKLQADPQTATAMIDVDAKNGEVTLKGTASNANQIGRAIALALDTQGVTKVSSDVKVSTSK